MSDKRISLDTPCFEAESFPSVKSFEANSSRLDCAKILDMLCSECKDKSELTKAIRNFDSMIKEKNKTITKL